MNGGDLCHPEKLPKTRPTNPRLRLDQNVMTQSCPTPPQSRRKFFLSPKSLRSPFSRSRQTSTDTTLSGKFLSYNRRITFITIRTPTLKLRYNYISINHLIKSIKQNKKKKQK